MEHLDLAGYITTPTHWTMPAFEQQDAIYLSNSRQMLEPILEETSEDEERAQNSWSQYEQNSNVWSSAESETGSVIRIEVTKDADSISERDFACPAKRARRSDECLHNGYTLQPSSLDDTVLLRRFQPSNNASGENSLERFLAYESQFGTSAVTRDSLGANSQQRSSTGSRRFDDFYSDSDSLSYHSLSRSSSLIQFESLERQLLQEQHSSLTSLGNSSPSLLSFEGACLSEENRKSSGEMGSGSGSGANSGCNSGNNSRRGSQSSLLRRFESSDGRLHQTYYDLDKLNFDETEESLRRLSISKSGSSGILAHDTNSTTEVKSDSESSTSSSSSSGKSILNACKPSIEDLTEHPENQPSERIGAYQRAGGKNSAENLSEDSGYCEPSTLKRSKSKSIPKNFEKFCEEDEFYTEHEHKAIEASNAVVRRADGYHDDDDDDDAVGGGDHNDSTNTHSKNSTLIEHDLCQTKIALDATFIVDMDNSLTSPSSTTVPTTEAQQPTWLCFDSVKNSHAREPPLEQQQQYQQQQLKQARSLAHSPSPVSDAGSTTSSASCASANSFTWLPTQTAQPPKQQQQQQQQQQLLLNNFPRYQRLLPESVDFCSEHLQNSLPEIRDASGSTFVDYFSQKLCAVQQLNGYAVDSLPKTNALAAKHAQRKCSLSDSDNSGSDSSATSASSPTTSTSSSSHAASKAKIQSSLVHNSGSCGRVASVPNELDKIGSKRSKRNKLKINKSASTTNSETASSESELTDEDFFDVNNARIRRSCSWSERRERNLQKFEGAFGKERRQELGDTPGQSVGAQSLGYMNASYQNLTLLDYSGRSANVSKSQSNFKRSSMESRQSSGDYESIICKGNFLLDELSEIYDKNASILNDQQLDLTKPLTLPSTSVVTPPKPAPRQRKHSNSSYSDLDTPDGAEPEVQHVQLTIRKPPARQKHGSRKEAPSSIVSESNEPLTFSSFGKTFDQDPTNLRTSYAQSLEKCNFDAKELSNADLSQTRSLPKRRFQSHAAVTKKRNLVSSTPNLNAFDPCGDDLEDDIYVSSAHTSMHQLPQNSTQKPLGILIPTGSRSSFSSKEVSFCPVVSKYSWQEQSSEECNEPSTSSSSTERQDDSTIHDKEEESDDELLDNADATVIYNTKENEMIATRYAQQLQNKQEQEERELQKEHELQKERELHKERELQKEREQQLRDNTNKHLREIIENEERDDKQRDDHKQPQELTQELRAENIAAVKTSQDERATQSENEKLVSVDVVEVASMPVVEPAKVSQQTTPSTITVTITTRASEVTTQSNEQQVNNNNALATPTKTTTPRPLSLYLPILSEPPTNRAHILYASQQLIDSLQHKQQQQHRYEQEFSESVPPGRTQSAYNLNSRQQVENNAARASTRMSNLAVKCSETNQLRANSGVDQSGMKHYNNNNELVKSKFKADEKHPSSKGFLSRFANGFRFSLRRNKKKQLQQQQQQQQLAAEQNGQTIMVKSEPPAKLKASAKSNGAANGTKQKSSKQNSPDFIYIPLKGPLPADAATTSNNSTHSSNESTTSQHVSQPASEPLVTGKPPLPKQPPRQVEKLVGPSQTIHPDHPQQQSAGQSAHYAPTEHGQIVANFMPNSNQFYTNAKPSTIDESFLDAERLYYDDFRNQLNSGMHANGRLVDAVSMDPNAGEQQSEADATPLHFSSPSRASVSQKTQMFNNMSNGRIYVKNTHQSGGGMGGSGAGCHGKIGLIETNLDTHETVISGKTRSLMELGPQQHQQRFKFIKRINANASGVGGGHNYQADLVAVDDDDDDDDDDAVNIVAADGSIVVVKGSSPQAAGQIASVRRPHKSMEFLLDKENQKNVLPPENELQKSHDQNPNALSEHQLRVQASLQRLNIPDWFRHYNQTTARSPDGNNAAPNTYKPGNFSRKRTSEASGRWTGLNSKTTSLSSLGSQRLDRSPLLLSPSAHSHHGGQTSMGAHQHHQHHAGTTSAHGAGGGSTFSRWSTSHLNSSQTSPSCSQRGSFSRGGPVNSSFISVVSGQSNSSAVRSSFRQPYLGWRSQEKLSQRTPHERLASSLLSTQPRPCSTPKNSNGAVKQHPVTPEIQSSIKEVTSAIVHYVNDQTQQQRSRSTSPNSRKCWLESSFVGTRPLDSPQTPIIENTTTFSASAGAAAALTQFNSGNSYNYNYNSNSNNNNSISSGYYNNSSATSSLYSAATTTNADVLRMNGLSCGVGDSASESLVTLRHMPQTATPTSLQVDPHTEQRLRRRSEGDAPKQQQQQQQQKLQQQNKQQHQQQQQQNSQNAKPNQAGDTLSAPMRRVSLGDSSESNNKTTSELQIKCRNTKCDQTATPNDAKKYYKSCHNCAHLYCSRECRRAHWEKHRKACLHSRASNLCRQVLATCKDDLDSQRHLSLLARRGFLSQGRGVVRVLFRSAEAAEGFIKHGFQCMGEASYVRWPDLMPAEMGLELYSELLKLSTEYKPDSKMLIYVAICVVSEAPGTAQAPVKWERQLVSRCAKLKLCKTILAELEQQHQALQLQQPLALVAVPEPATEILILTFNPSAHTTASRRDVILSNILGILSRRGVFLRKHYPEIYQRLQTYADGQTDKFQPVTLHPRDSQSGLSFVCIIMPVHSESGIIKMPSVADGGNRVNTIDVGAVNALANLVDDATIQS